MVIRDREEELALFFDMRRREEDQSVSPSTGSNNSKNSSDTTPLSSSSSIVPRRTAAERFLYSENEKSDYDWLFALPNTLHFEKESPKSSRNQHEEPHARCSVLKSRVGNVQEEPLAKSKLVSKHVDSAPSGVLTSATRPATRNGQGTVPATTKPSRSSMPTLRAKVPSTKPTASVPKSSGKSTAEAPRLSRSSSVKKTQKPSEIPDYSREAPPNLRRSLPGRPVSASRVRAGAFVGRTYSVEGPSKERARRQAYSPSGQRASTGYTNGEQSTVSSVRRGEYLRNSEDVSPVFIGTKMVERVVNMRKLAPPKQHGHNSGGKSTSSLDGSGFGRSLSKSSLDMALRHMDITRSISGNLRVSTNLSPASSMCNNRSSGSWKSRTDSVSDSSLATSDDASSELKAKDNS